MIVLILTVANLYFRSVDVTLLDWSKTEHVEMLKKQIDKLWALTLREEMRKRDNIGWEKETKNMKDN